MALNKNVAKGIKTRQENELRENNKLIAEFMGLCPLSRSGFISDKNQEYYGSLSDLHYHTSWDWLMPVIKEVYNTEEVYDMGLEFHEIACQMFEDGIEEVYKTVIHTIKLINENRAKEE